MLYSEYLKLETLLDCQKTITKTPDEMLFIITHQVHELWFKQINCDLQSILKQSFDSDNDSVDKLNCISRIMDLCVAQVNILDTMKPIDFLRFRDKLGKASGIQSDQFKMIENLLTQVLQLLDHQLSEIDLSLETFQVSDTEYYDGKLDPNTRRNIVHLFTRGTNHYFYRVIQVLLDVDQKINLWRFKHLQLVQRIIGSKMGTGGTSKKYLIKGIENQTVFDEITELIGTIRVDEHHF
jgi:tryptophan 2,3-dioxygenase